MHSIRMPRRTVRVFNLDMGCLSVVLYYKYLAKFDERDISSSMNHYDLCWVARIGHDELGLINVDSLSR